MLTRTTEAGIQALVFLALRAGDTPASPRAIAGELGLSPSYLAKVSAQLVRADLLRAQRGVKGGVLLSRPPRAIRLLEVVEALQGRIIGRYCEYHGGTSRPCAFHAAMQEIHEATVKILSGWTLQDLAACPVGRQRPGQASRCLMRRLAGAGSRGGANNTQRRRSTR